MDTVTFNNRFENKINILNENKGDYTIYDYHQLSKESDPKYLSWLLGDHIDDFGLRMTEDDKELLQEFEKIIKKL